MADEMKSTRIVMVVDDDDDVRETYAIILEDEGCTVYTASNGRKALDALATRPHPCLIFLDLMMPVMDGREFMAALKADASIAAIPVVVLSATRVDPASIGAVHGIFMPISVEAILEAVEQYCGPPPT
jgi:CheY-like chemotaxis protein